MVEFEIKVHPKQRLAYIPKEIVNALGLQLKAIPNMRGVYLCSNTLSTEEALSSVKAIYEHLKQEAEFEKKKRLEVHE